MLGKYKPLFILFIIVIIVQVGLAELIMLRIKSTNERGLFGDMFGDINALFSGLAFAGVIFAIILQSKELELQRTEMQQSRKQFEIGNKLAKMELLNIFFSRYDSSSFRKVRKEAAQLLINNKSLPTDSLEETKPLDEVLNFLQELGLAQKHEVLDRTFIAGRFGGLARCYYSASKDYIKRVQQKEGKETWQSVVELVEGAEDEVKIIIDKAQVESFLRREAQLKDL